MFGYPSWIAELRGKSPAGIELRRYAYKHLEPGEALVIVRERAEPSDKHAGSYRHRDVHIGYVPRRHRWIADAIDDGLRLFDIAETVKTGWVFRRRATSVRTQIVVSTMALASTAAKVRGGEQLSHKNERFWIRRFEDRRTMS